ncbi:dihydropteroate synthase [Vampirovibrio chlorellavorus]|uniref:dihydropteroate synthase n=1 Tax=Vampirovibrio chlorellavorus TaxID=758823 RepID=UPI0026F2E7BF|nr:dihydropteroate synthase [Vampirovibrio chlorellavorus]
MSRTQIMAILNVTPDSFSDGGALRSLDQVVQAAQEALQAGADILDIGGESTRPNATTISPQAESDRVLPAIRAILEAFPRACISIDTRKAMVAEQALKAGAQMVNDVSGFQYDPAMAEVCGQAGCPVVLMHSQGTPETMQHNPCYPHGVLQAVLQFFERQIDRAQQAGISRHNIILDPGFGFGKTLTHNLTLLHQLDTLKTLGLPILAGTSRKSFLTLGQQTILPIERDALTAASLAMAIERGAKYVRIHNPATQVPVIRFIEATRGVTPEVLPDPAKYQDRLCYDGQ